MIYWYLIFASDWIVQLVISYQVVLYRIRPLDTGKLCYKLQSITNFYAGKAQKSKFDFCHLAWSALDTSIENELNLNMDVERKYGMD